MGPYYTSQNRSRAPFMVALLAPATAAAFLVLRYRAQGILPAIAAQVVYSAPLAVALFFSAMATEKAPRGSRSRKSWTLLCVALVALLGSEIGYSLRLLAGLSVPGPVGWFSDVMNLAATAVFIAYVAVFAAIDRLSWSRRLLIFVDLLALIVTASVLSFRFYMFASGAQWAAVGVGAAARQSAYGSVGLLIVLMCILIAWLTRVRMPAGEFMVGCGILVVGFATMVWPAWGFAVRNGAPSWVEGFDSAMFLIGYSLMAVGAGWRVLVSDDSWYSTPSLAWADVTWPGIVTSTTVFASVVVLALATLTSRTGSGEGLVFLGGSIVVSVCMVVRTGISSVELGSLRRMAATDSLTGAGSADRLLDRMTQLSAGTKRFGEGFMLTLLDLDGFEHYNKSRGRLAGDEALSEISALLSQWAGPDSLFRVDEDEFAILGEVSGMEDAARQAERVMRLVELSAAGAHGVRSSAGYSICPDHSSDPAMLLAYARTAQVWAKNRARGRAIAYDAHVMSGEHGHDVLASIGTEVRLDIVRALSAAADARDPANHRHADNVAILSGLLGRAIGMDVSAVSDLKTAALLHDVGKIALPDSMLGGRTLTIRERRAAEDHAALGGRLVEALGIEGLSDWVASHHERWDGAGYPSGLAGDQIPLQARIIALADAYDGMTTGKRYGAPMSKAAALQEIDLGIGARFDPEIAEKFIEVVGTSEALGWSESVRAS